MRKNNDIAEALKVYNRFFPEFNPLQEHKSLLQTLRGIEFRIHCVKHQHKWDTEGYSDLGSLINQLQSLSLEHRDQVFLYWETGAKDLAAEVVYKYEVAAKGWAFIHHHLNKNYGKH